MQITIADSPYSIAAHDDPRVYPGVIPSFSFIFCGDEIVENFSLDHFLSEHNATPMTERFPVLAIGSNASPAQLQRKFPEGAVIPVLRATVRNLDVVYSCHMSAYGAIPSTVIPAEGVAVEAHVCFLDEPQIRIMDHTEGFNYDRISMDGVRYPLKLSNGDDLPRYDLYRSRRGVLSLGDAVFRLTAIPAHESLFVPATESEMLEKVITAWNLDHPTEAFNSVDDLLSQQKENPGLITQIKTWLYPQYAKF